MGRITGNGLFSSEMVLFKQLVSLKKGLKLGNGNIFIRMEIFGKSIFLILMGIK